MTARKAGSRRPRRHKSYYETHREMLDTAVRLISQKGVGALSNSALARAMDIHRTTVYYHFESREALIRAVKVWSAERIASAFSADAPQHERIDSITRFVLENPELIKLWIEELLSPGDIRQSYPFWDALVKGIAATSRSKRRREAVDAEVYSVVLLTSAIIGPRVFRNRVAPRASTDSIVGRFRKERQRLLRLDGLLRD
ncbi:MAG TPA: TetR/AcrR family transcriptional regulator [Myxococcota bacterium]|nr:TetR/AcrR family transcriptional regulator [Myxococcota bacterium]